MKEYTIASIAVLSIALLVAGVRGLWRDRALWVGFLLFAIMTVGADVVLTGVGVYGYDRQFTMGLFIGQMPLEDLLYGLALYLVAVVAWSWDRQYAS